MRFMILVRANAHSEAGLPPDDILQPVMAAMTAYNTQLSQAGVLLDAAGLQPSSTGWRVQYRSGQGRVVDGPFAETKELIAGYTLIEVDSREEAMEWVRRFPAPFGLHADSEIEVRQLYGDEDLAPRLAAG